METGAVSATGLLVSISAYRERHLATSIHTTNLCAPLPFCLCRILFT